MIPTNTPLPDEDPPKADYTSSLEGNDPVPEGGIADYYADTVRHQAEHNGASYRLRHMRSAPQMQDDSLTARSQGRLLRPAVPYDDQFHGDVPQSFTQTPNGEQLQFADGPAHTSDAHAQSLRVQPPAHPVYFGRGRGEVERLQNNRHRPDPAGSVTAQGRTFHGGIYRTEQRYQ